jgi:hypothetical protein
MEVTMATTAPLMKREAIVINGRGNPVLDLDPVMLQVDADGLADAYDSALVGILSTLESFDASGTCALVWSTDHKRAVRFLCPACDDVQVAHDAVVELDPEAVPMESVACVECNG